MSDKILDGAKVCASMIFEAVFKFGLEEKVRAEHPDIRVPLSVLTLTWLVPALDYVMSGEGRVTRQHRSFINEALATDFAVADLDAATSSEGGIGIPFNATVVPAFLLLADRVEPGAAEHLCLPIAGLLRAACAWDGKRTLREIARLNEILEPIERRFGFVVQEITPENDKFWSSEDEAKPSKRKSAKANEAQAKSRGEPKPQKYKPAAGIAELDSLVGLAAVKKEVRNIANLAHYLMQRKTAGLPAPNFSLHMVFTGNPGTGKTTVARLIGEIYRDVGVLESGQLIEVDRSGLVGAYLGQTAPKTRKVFMRAKGGVLFIDEAYNLALSEDRDDEYGNEAIGTLLKLMEDHRQEVVVIVAGYTKEMQRFIASNPGLQSRFTRTLEFDDYSEGDLAEIFFRLCETNELVFGSEVKAAVIEAMRALLSSKGENFGNAREVRTLFERVMQNQANRLSVLNKPTVKQLRELLREDIA